MIGRWFENNFFDVHYNLALEQAILYFHPQNDFSATVRFWTTKISNKTDSAILERFSSEELWILFVEKKCQECDLPEDKCNNL